MKSVIFEGAGWSKSESSGDVGNCRIRGTFKNDTGKEIYLELTGSKVHKYMPGFFRKFDIVAHISHLFYTIDQRTNYSEGLTQFLHQHFEWNKANILAFINKNLDCSFTQLEVREDWCGFALDGKRIHDFHLRTKLKASK